MKKIALEIESAEADTIVIVSPHGPVQMDVMSINGSEILAGNFLQFGDQTAMEFQNDIDLGTNIEKIAAAKEVPAEIVDGGIPLDHGAMVPLYYLAKNQPNMKVVPIAFSYLDYRKHFKFGEAIFEAAESINRNIVLVASGDLSHRLTPDAPAGYSPQGEKFDKLLIGLLEENKTSEILDMNSSLIEEAGECGLRSIIILLGALATKEYRFEKLSYEGPFGVGYLVGRFRF